MNKVLFSHKSDEWETPIELFEKLDQEYGFTLDPCSTDRNCKCDKHYTISDNGLIKSWKDEVVFCNPPYSEIKEWVKKANEERANGATTVMLIPARTDTRWFHQYIYMQNGVKVIFLKGRLKFSGKGSAPFPSMIVVFNKGGE